MSYVHLQETISLSFERLVVAACDQMNRALDLRSEGLRFDSQHWPSVEVLGKLHISHCLIAPMCNGYLVPRSKDDQ